MKFTAEENLLACLELFLNPGLIEPDAVKNPGSIADTNLHNCFIRSGAPAGDGVDNTIYSYEFTISGVCHARYRSAVFVPVGEIVESIFNS